MGLIIFLPCSVIGFFKKDLRIFSIIFWAQFIILSSVMLYTSFGIRYLVAFVSIAFPLLALSYTNKMNILKFIFIIYAVFFTGYISLYTPSRPFIYLSRILIENKNLKDVQNKIREFQYKFYGPLLVTESGAYKNSVLTYCKNDNKIGIFMTPPALVYNAKYLELNNNCKIDTLNMLHIENYELQKYKALVFEKEGIQNTDVINKNDIKNPLINSNKANCTYIISKRAPKSSKGLEKAISASCIINKNYIKNLGFKKTNEFRYIIPHKNGIKHQSTEVWVK